MTKIEKQRIGLLKELVGHFVLLYSQYGTAVYLAEVTGYDTEVVWVRYPRNPEGVPIDHDTFALRLRRVLAKTA